MPAGLTRAWTTPQIAGRRSSVGGISGTAANLLSSQHSGYRLCRLEEVLPICTQELRGARVRAPIRPGCGHCCCDSCWPKTGSINARAATTGDRQGGKKRWCGKGQRPFPPVAHPNLVCFRVAAAHLKSHVVLGRLCWHHTATTTSPFHPPHITRPNIS